MSVSLASLYLSDVAVATRYGIGRSTLWRWVAEGAFPKPVKVGPRATRWRLADLEAHDAQLTGNQSAR